MITLLGLNFQVHAGETLEHMRFIIRHWGILNCQVQSVFYFSECFFFQINLGIGFKSSTVRLNFNFLRGVQTSTTQVEDDFEIL